MQHNPSLSVRIDRTTIRELAVSASVDERTIRRRLAGVPVRGIASDRADRALRQRGIEPGVLASPTEA